MAASPARLRRAGLAVLILGVLLAHVGVGDWFVQTRMGWGDAERVPPRLQAAFVRELEVKAPPPAPTAAAPRPRPKKKKALPAPVEAAASQPEPAPSEPALAQPEPAAPQVEPAPDAVADAASAPDSSASAAVAAAVPASAASQPVAFEWPPSTRLSYSVNGYMSGQYGQGPLEGSARVQWIRQDRHYQVHLDVSAAGIFQRRMTSDGELGDSGLRPRRFDQEDTRFGFAQPPITLHFLPDAVVLPDGTQRERPEGVQDIASQLVQMTWLFTTQPALLRPGVTIDVPVALAKPARIEVFTYEVIEPETITTPFGAIETFHVKPRSLARPGMLSMQTWVAPSLQYLPVRVRIVQNEGNYLDLLIERKPQQSER